MSAPEVSEPSPCRISQLLLARPRLRALWPSAQRWGVFLTINIRVLDGEFDNYVCAHVDTPQLLVVICVLGFTLKRHRRQALRRDSAPVDRKSDAVDEAGIITGEEDDRRSKFLGLSYATCWC